MTTRLMALLLACCLVGCGGSGGGHTAPPPSPPPARFTIGVAVVGLTGTLVLQNNLADDLELVTSGNFRFATSLAAGMPYHVTIKTQPAVPPQHCGITNDSGTVTAERFQVRHDPVDAKPTPPGTAAPATARPIARADVPQLA